MDGAAGLHVVRGDGQFIRKLLSSEDEPDLLDVDTLFLLKCLFDLKDSVLWVEVELLLPACQRLDHQLHICVGFCLN